MDIGVEAHGGEEGEQGGHHGRVHVIVVGAVRSFLAKLASAIWIRSHYFRWWHIPILGEEVDPPKCVVKRKAGKLILVLAKREADKVWYELRKTKGVGDSEFGKIVPDGGEDVEFIR